MQLSPLLPLLPALASAMPVDSVDKSPASVDTPATLVDTPAISADKPISWVSMQATTPEMIAASAMQLSFIDDIGHVFKGIAEGVAKKAEDLVHDFDPEQCDILACASDFIGIIPACSAMFASSVINPWQATSCFASIVTLGMTIPDKCNHCL